MPTKRQPRKPDTARLTYRTLRDLITDAARYVASDDFHPCLKQVWLRKVGDHIEARATDRYVAAFILADLDAQAWPDNLDVGLTPRQWRTALDALKPVRGESLDQPLTLKADDARVVIGSESGSSITLARNRNAVPFPNLDHLRTVPTDSLTAPLIATKIDGRFLARTPRTPGFVIASRADDPKVKPLHIVGDLWHIVIQPQRPPSGEGCSLPAWWITPESDGDTQ